MSRGYKYKESPVKRLTVYIDEDEEYHGKVEELEQVIQVTDEHQGGNGNINQVLAKLAQQYKLRSDHFKVWRVSNTTHLIKLPSVLDKNDVIDDMTIWGIRNKWWFLHFDLDSGVQNHYMKFRVQIRVLNFPFQCWTRNKITKAISSIGYVEYLNTENIEGSDRRFIELGINCDDPRNIPRYLDVFYGKNKWRSCRIVVLDWSFDTWVSDSARDGENHRHYPGWSSDENDEEDHQNINTRRELVNRHERLQSYYNFRSSPSSGSSQPSDLVTNSCLHRGLDKTTGMFTNEEEEQYFGPHRPGLGKMQQKKILEKTGNSDKVLEMGQKKRSFNWAKVIQYLGCPGSENKINLNQTTQQGDPDPLGLKSQGKDHGQIKSSEAMHTFDYFKRGSLLTGFTKVCMMTPDINCCIGKRKQSNQVYCFDPSIDTQEQCLSIKKHPVVNKKVIHNTHQTFPFYSNQRSSLMMEQNVSMEEDELIKRLLEQAKVEDDREQVIRVPDQAILARNWRRCILVKVLTEARVNEETFSSLMRSAWKVHQNTIIELRKDKTFLVEFVNERDLFRVLDGWWHFRGELVAMKRVFTREEAELVEVDTIDLWVQAYGFPTGLILPSAIPDIMRVVGTPISDLQVIYSNGMKVYKIKLMVPLTKPVKDTLSLENEMIGKYKVYLVYEKIKKICLYCGLIGHVKEQCLERKILLRMKETEKYKDNAALLSLPEVNFKPWIIDQTKVPLVGSSVDHSLDSIGSGGEDFQGNNISNKGKQAQDISWVKWRGEQTMQLCNLDHDIFQSKGGQKRGVDEISKSHTASHLYKYVMDDEVNIEDEQHLNKRRAREAIPNSPPPSP